MMTSPTEISNDSSITYVGPSKLSSMLPKPTERGLFLGQTGSGKTTLARHLLRHRKYVVVFDGKGLINWRGYVKIGSLSRLMRLKPSLYPKVVYQPDVEEYSKANIERFFKWVYLRRHCTCYVDEVLSAVQYGIPKYYTACITRGRERGIEVWNSVQRPSHVPLTILTESENFYVFRLILDEDRKRVYELTGMNKDSIRELPKQEFYYVPLGEKAQGIYKLNIK